MKYNLLSEIKFNSSKSCPRLLFSVDKIMPAYWTQFTPEAQNVLIPVCFFALSRTTPCNYGVVIYLPLKIVMKHYKGLQIALVTSYDKGVHVIGEYEVAFTQQLGSKDINYRLGGTDIVGNAYYNCESQSNKAFDDVVRDFPPHKLVEDNLINSIYLQANPAIQSSVLHNNAIIAYVHQPSYQGWSPLSPALTLSDGNAYVYNNCTIRFYSCRSHNLFCRYFNNQYWTGNGVNTKLTSAWSMSINGSEKQPMPFISNNYPALDTPIPDEQQFELKPLFKNNIAKNSEYIRLNYNETQEVGTNLDFKGNITIPNATLKNQMCNKGTFDKIVDKNSILRRFNFDS